MSADSFLTILKVGAELGEGYLSSRATGQAANLQATAATSVADIQAMSAADQLDFLRTASRRGEDLSLYGERADYGQWAADLRNRSNLLRDQAEAGRVAGNVLGRNKYEADIAAGRSTYGQQVARERRMGNLGQMVGAPPRTMGRRFEGGFTEVPETEWSELIVPAFEEPPPRLSAEEERAGARQRAQARRDEQRADREAQATDEAADEARRRRRGRSPEPGGGRRGLPSPRA
jgi:hypothetical protein